MRLSEQRAVKEDPSPPHPMYVTHVQTPSDKTKTYSETDPPSLEAFEQSVVTSACPWGGGDGGLYMDISFVGVLINTFSTRFLMML